MEAIDKMPLTKREIEVLQLIVDELTSTEIAKALDISVRTVETHRKNISQKVNVRSSIGLVKYAIRSGFVEHYIFVNDSTYTNETNPN